MKALDKYVIFHESREEFLHTLQRKAGMDKICWAKTPMSARQYDSLQNAQEDAEFIAGVKHYDLTLCQLHESKTQIALSEIAKVVPNDKP